MLRKFREKILRNDEMYLGDKKVKIKKLVPAKWKLLFDSVDTLPGLIIQVATERENFYMVVLQAIDMAMDEIVKVVSILTDIDEDYINNHVGLDELVEFITRTVNVNRLDQTVKNVKSLLPKKR